MGNCLKVAIAPVKILELIVVVVPMASVHLELELVRPTGQPEPLISFSMLSTIA